jgi:hypothetical protein
LRKIRALETDPRPGRGVIVNLGRENDGVKTFAIGTAHRVATSGLRPAVARIRRPFQVPPRADPNLCMPIATIDVPRANSLKCTIRPQSFVLRCLVPFPGENRQIKAPTHFCPRAI